MAERVQVTGAMGNRIALRTVGSHGTPVVFIHGWAQSSRCWQAQFGGPLARTNRLIALDLRGHGDSPDGPVSGAGFAADLAAVLAWIGEPAVVVGWSYGGLVITDYLREHGTAALRGILLVGAITEIGKGHPGGKVGPAMRAALPAALSEDPGVAVPALAAFVKALSVGAEQPGALAQEMLGDALRVAPATRAALFARSSGSANVLRGIDIPTVLVHGAQDAVVAVSAAEYAADLIPGAKLEVLPETGHLPFRERAREFHAQLGSLLFI